jgi:hypothetical protein
MAQGCLIEQEREVNIVKANKTTFCGVANKDLKKTEKGSRTLSLWHADDKVSLLIMGLNGSEASDVLDKANPKEGKVYEVVGKWQQVGKGKDTLRYLMPETVAEVK